MQFMGWMQASPSGASGFCLFSGLKVESGLEYLEGKRRQRFNKHLSAQLVLASKQHHPPPPPPPGGHGPWLTGTASGHVHVAAVRRQS